MLVVDDAQRLDAGSAALVHQVVTEGVCRLVATVRSGEAAPDAIESLWTAGWAARVELHGLSLVETGELLAAVLDGPVDGATRQRFWETTRGNSLYLRDSCSEPPPPARSRTREGSGVSVDRRARRHGSSSSSGPDSARSTRRRDRRSMCSLSPSASNWTW